MRSIDRFKNMPSAFQAFAGSDCVQARLGFRAEDTSDVLTIYVHDVIGDPFEGLDSGSLVPIIHGARGKPIVMNINSPGGWVYDAISVYSTLVEHDAEVRADITGMAASAATIMASAADKIRISTSGEYMVHRAWTMAMGNAASFENLANDLRKVDREIADILAARSGLSVEGVLDMMTGGDEKDGTSFTGQEAIEQGFADELIPLKKKPAKKEKEKDTFKKEYMSKLVAHLQRQVAREIRQGYGF